MACNTDICGDWEDEQETPTGQCTPRRVKRSCDAPIAYTNTAQSVSLPCPEGTVGETIEVTVEAGTINNPFSVEAANAIALAQAEAEAADLRASSPCLYPNTEQVCTETCPEGSVTEPITVTIEAGEYLASSQEAADALALAAACAQASLLRDASPCYWVNTEQQCTDTCPEGLSGDPITVTVPAGEYTSYESQAAADAEALAAACAEAAELRSLTPCEDVEEGFLMFATGQNERGSFGNGTILSVESFIQIGVVDSWTQVEGTFYHSAAIRLDGTLWTTGHNNNGQLGQGDTTQRETWTQVGTDTDWTDVKCGQFSTIARKSDGTLWATGENAHGQLGIGVSGPDVLSFTQIGTDTDWSRVFACGYFHTLAIKNSGALYAWGEGDSGQLGQGAGDLTDHVSPIQVGSATNWTKLAAGEAHTTAINSSGELWVTGFNVNGQLGLGDHDDRYDLTQISGTTYSQVACGQYHTIVLLTNGTIWGVGKNNRGNLGRGNTTLHFNTYAQIGSATNWRGISCGVEHTMAINNSNQIWGCGSNLYGNLGNGVTAISQTTLVQETTLATDWDTVIGAYRSTFALKPAV